MTKLTIVGLPIGNINDISFRALKVLQESKFIVCEDTRMFSNLWSKLMQMELVKKFDGTLRFVNDFNEARVMPRLLNEISALEEATLVSDAGMPLISDPGYKLVREGLDLGWEIDVVPGPTAESAALAVSGLPTDKYFFVGFLPKKPGKRNEMLRNIKEMGEKIKSTAVFYESPFRIEKIIVDMVSVFGGESPACLAADLTKMSQKISRGTLDSLLEEVKGKKIKGELALMVSVGD